jgi:hypothetical protein
VAAVPVAALPVRQGMEKDKPSLTLIAKKFSLPDFP